MFEEKTTDKKLQEDQLIILTSKSQKKFIKALMTGTPTIGINIMEISKKIGVSYATAYDGWQKICRHNKVEIKLLINDRLIIQQILGQTPKKIIEEQK